MVTSVKAASETFARGARSMSVLHVEANPVDQKLVELALHGSLRAPHVYQVGTVREAVSFLRREAGYEESPRPHLILLGLDLQMDGFGLLRELRADAQLRSIAVVILSGLVYAETLLKDYREQVREFIAKPENAESSLDLAERIGALLQGS